MNLKSIFLTLSMNEQICITILALNIFCALVILSICGSLAYEILKEDYRQKNYTFLKGIKTILNHAFIFKTFIYCNMRN